MQAEKLSISVSSPLVRFLEQYQTNHKLKSRSQVIEKALQLLRNQELEYAYRQASHEIEPDWDLVALDGLDIDETW